MGSTGYKATREKTREKSGHRNLRVCKCGWYVLMQGGVHEEGVDVRNRKIERGKKKEVIDS